jgi:hypothetical protein
MYFITEPKDAICTLDEVPHFSGDDAMKIYSLYLNKAFINGFLAG